MALSGERLKDLRKKHGFSQEELAAKVGISARLLQKYEAGENDPSLENAGKLAHVLGTSTDYLAGLVSNSVPYAERDLSLLERFVIFLIRSGGGQLPPQIEALVNQAAREAEDASRVVQEQATDDG